MKSNTTGNSSVKQSAHNQPQTSSCSQTSEDTVRNMSNNSNSSCNSTIKNDVNDPTTATNNKLNKNYDINFKSEIDENDSTSPRSLRIADQENETDAGESMMCFDDEDEEEEEEDENENEGHRELVGSSDRQTESASNNQNSPSVSDDNKALTVENRVYRIEACNEKNVNVIGKNLSSDSHSL
jgi:hypothetical protein